MKANVLHVMNSISPTSSGYDIASRLDSQLFNVAIAAWMGSTKVDDPSIISLEGRGKLDCKAISKLDSILGNNRFDIIHTHHNVSGSIARVLAKRHRVPVIIDTEHGSHRGYKLSGNIFNDMTLFLADRIVNVSQWVYDSYYNWERIIIPKGRQFILHNGVDMDRIDRILGESRREQNMRSGYSIGESDVLLLHAARMTYIKNQENMIIGFAKAAEKHPCIKLMMVGDGELKNDLQSLALTLGVGDRVIFTGLVPREQVYRLMNEADGFIMNSHSEGLSVALLEAMAFGLPCILSNIPSFRETARGRDIGEFIEKNDAASVFNAISRFARTDRDTLYDKGKRARQLVEEFYSIENTVKGYEKMYMELLAGKTGQVHIFEEELTKGSEKLWESRVL